MTTVAEIEVIALGPEQNGIRMTPEEFDSVAEWDADFRYELVNGVVIVNPIPLPAQRGPNQELGRMLLNYRDEHPRGSALDDTLEEEYVRVGNQRRRADRVIWAGPGRQPDPAADLPTMAVEFVSEGRRNWQRDYVEKRDEYLQAGIREYWVIDRFGRVMTVDGKTGEGFKEILVKENDTYRSDLLPGFELPLRRLLAVADRWSRT